MAGILQTGTISHYNTAERVIRIMHYRPTLWHIPARLCAFELLPKEFTGGGGSLTICIAMPHNPDTLAQH